MSDIITSLSLAADQKNQQTEGEAKVIKSDEAAPPETVEAYHENLFAKQESADKE